MVDRDITNPRIDLSNTTSSAFDIINKKSKTRTTFVPGRDDTQYKTTNHKARVKVYTPFDDRTHTYFHSLSIDKDIADFMGTAELKCPYDSDLMEYWEPARAYCVIYGTNKGSYKILFIGRVRELRQSGYELVITLQDYGWKFKQLVTQSYAKDNVIGKDGYTILKLMFYALRIDSWVVSPAAKYRLKQVGIDEDGNVTLNKKKLEKMPDLLNRLKKSDPRKSINQYTVYNKIKESELHNIDNINYTLKYEKPTKQMQKVSKENSDFAAGKQLYNTNYSSGSGGSGGSSGSSSSKSKKNKTSKTTSASGNPRPPANLCSGIGNETVRAAMKVVWAYQRGYTNGLSDARSTVVNYAKTYPSLYRAQVAPCLNTLSKWCTRSNKHNGAAAIKRVGDSAASRGNPVNPLFRNNTPSRGSSRRSSSAPKKKGLLGMGGFLGFL